MTFAVSCALAARRRCWYWHSSYVQVETSYYAPPDIFFEFKFSNPMPAKMADIAAMPPLLTANDVSGRRPFGG
jgi:hypothetical protein